MFAKQLGFLGYVAGEGLTVGDGLGTGEGLTLGDGLGTGADVRGCRADPAATSALSAT